MRRITLLMMLVLALLTIAVGVAFAANPTVSISVNAVQPDPYSVYFTAVFSETVYDFASTGVTLGGTADPTRVNVTPVDPGKTFTIQVTGIKNDGTVSAFIPAGMAMNWEDQKNSDSNTASTEYTRPRIPVTVTLESASSASSFVDFRVRFAEPVALFDSTKLVLGGTAGDNLQAIVAVKRDSYLVRVTGIERSGDVTLSVPQDAVEGNNGMWNAASNIASTHYTIPSPTATFSLDPGQEDPTSNKNISLLLKFNLPVNSFPASALVLGGTANPTTATITKLSPRSYSVVVSGMSVSGTVTAVLPVNSVTNLDGVSNASPSNEITVNYDTINPTARLTPGPRPRVNATPVDFTATFSEPVSDFVNTGVQVMIGGTTAFRLAVPSVAVSAIGNTGTTYKVSVSGMDQSGDVTIQLLDGAAVSVKSDKPSRGTNVSATVYYDETPVSVKVQQSVEYVTNDSTALSPINFDVFFEEPIHNFNADVLDLNFTGTASSGILIDDSTGKQKYDVVPTIAIADTKYVSMGDPDPTHYIIRVYMDNTKDIDGTISLDIPADMFLDDAGNPNEASITGERWWEDSLVLYDAHPRFTVTALGPTNQPPIKFFVKFNESVGGFNKEDVHISSTNNDVVFDLQQVAPFDDTTWEISAKGMQSSEQISVFVDENPAYESQPFPRPSTPGYSGWLDGIRTYHYNIAHPELNGGSSASSDYGFFDVTNPKVILKQAPTQSDPTVSGPINFIAKFSEPVAGFDSNDVIVSGTAGATTATVSNPLMDRMTYNIDVSDMRTSGSVIVTVPANVAYDLAGNGNDPFTTGPSANDDNVVTYGAIPAVTINQAADQSDPTTVSSIKFSIQFATRVTGFTPQGVKVTGSAFLSNGVPSVSITDSGDNMHFTAAVSGMVRTGTVIADVISGAAIDVYNNPTPPSTSTDNIVSWTKARPTVTVDRTGAATQTNPLAIMFSAVFSEPVTGFSSDGVAITGTAGAKSAVVTDLGDHARYTISVSGMTQTGAVIVNIPDSVAKNMAGDYNIASTSPIGNNVQYIKSFISTINQAASQADPTNSSPIHFTAVFNAPVIDFTSSKVTLNGSAVVPGMTINISQISPNDGTAYDVAVGGMSKYGTVTAIIPGGMVHDFAGNACEPSTSTDDTVLYDRLNPSVSINKSSSQNDPTTTLPVIFDVTFSEVVTGFTMNSVNLSGSGGPFTYSVTDTGDHQYYKVTVSKATRYGTIIASIPGGVVSDAIGNANDASTSADNEVVYDTPPTVTITKAVGQADPTNGTTINFSVVFSQSVTGFGSDDLLITGTAGANSAVVTGSGATYNVAVRGMTNTGMVRVSVKADSVKNTNGTTNLASDTASVEYDEIRPSVTVNQADTQADPSNASEIHFTVVFDKPVTGLTLEGISITGTAGWDVDHSAIIDSGDHMTYDLVVGGMTRSGSVIANVAANAAYDVIGNVNSSSTSTDNTVTYDTPLTVQIEQATEQSDPANSTPIKFTAVFSDYVDNFTPAGILITGSATFSKKTVVVRNSGDYKKYTIEISGMDGAGTVVASIPSGAAHNSNGFACAASTSVDNSVSYMTTAPTVKINQADGQPDPTNIPTIRFTAEFSAPVTGFDPSDVTIGGTASGLKTVAIADTGDHMVYKITVSNITSDGTVIASIGPRVAQDANGIGNEASTSIDNVVGCNTIRPTVEINVAPGQEDPTLTVPINFTAVFSKPMKDFTDSKVMLSGSANPSGVDVTEISPFDGTTYNLAVYGMSNDGSVSASITDSALTDLIGNPTFASHSTNNTVQYKTRIPCTVYKALDQADPTAASPIHFIAAFIEPVIGFTSSDLVVTGTAGATNATISDIGDGETFDVVVSGMLRPGTVTVSIPSDVCHNALGYQNEASISTNNTVTFNNQKTNVTITKGPGQADPTNSPSISFMVTFSSSVTGFSNSDVVIGGTAGATTVSVTGSGATYIVYVNGMTQSGDVRISIPDGVVVDGAGNENTASTADGVVQYDNVQPTVSVAKASGQSDPGSGSTVNFTAVFSKSVTGFASNAITLGGTAVANNVTVTDSGDHKKYNLAVTGMTTSGTVTIMVDAGLVNDLVGNVGTGTSSASVIYNDDIQPTATVSKASGQLDPTNISPINFTAVFDKPVTGLTSAGVTIGGTSGATLATVTGSGTTYNIAVTGMTGQGLVTLAINANAVTDVAGNGNSVSNIAQVMFDATSPTVTIEKAAGQTDPTKGSPVNFTAVFDKSVTGLTSAGITIGGTSGATLATVTGSGTTYNIAVTGMTGQGLVTLAIKANAVTDAAGNANLVSNTAQVMFDPTAPTVTIVKAAGQLDPTKESPINFNVVFNKSVTGFSSAGIALSGTAGATTAVVTGSDDNYNVAVSGMTKPGTVIVAVNANAAKDVAGNANVASNSTQVLFDTTAPTVTVSKASGQLDPANISPINFTAVFDKPVTGLTNAGVTIGGTAGATAVAVTGSGTTYNIAVTGMTGQGVVTLTVNANAAKDAAGNDNAPSNAVQVQFDPIFPTVTINQAAGQADPTKSSPINFEVVFSKPVTGFSSAGIVVSGTAGVMTATVTGSGATYNVAVNGMTKTGTVIATVNANAAKDTAGNWNQASTSTDNTVTFDNDPLTVTVNQAASQADPTNAGSINYTVTFNKPVTDFSPTSLAITGTAGGVKTATVTGTGTTTYKVTVSGMTTPGTVVLDIPANAAHDKIGNGNVKATYTDNTVTFDNKAPVVSFTKPTNAASCVRNAKQVSIAGTATDDTGIVEVTWSTASGLGGACTGNASWSASNLIIENGQDTITVTAKDSAGNTSSDTLAINVVEVSPGDAWQGLCMVSMPIIPDDTDPKKVVSFAGNSWAYYSPDANEFAVYPDQNTWFLPIEETPVRGYWARFNSTPVTPTGMIPDQDKPVSISLKAGWNMIGQPFITPIKWDLNAIKVVAGSQQMSLADACSAGWIADYAWGWTSDSANSAGGEYYLVYDTSIIPEAVGELAPWQAYWVIANYDCELILPTP